MWIVFVDEGQSLHDLLYTDDAEAGDEASADGKDFGTKGYGSESTPADQRPIGGQSFADNGYTDNSRHPNQDEQSDGNRGAETGAGISMVTPSRLWSAIKADSVQGEGEAMREILRQVLLALTEVHAEGVTHRDVKPENLIVGLRRSQPPPAEDAHDSITPRIKLADFGSANVQGIPAELWPPPSRRPSRAEETEDYSPPEVRPLRVHIQAPDCSSCCCTRDFDCRYYFSLGEVRDPPEQMTVLLVARRTISGRSECCG